MLAQCAIPFADVAGAGRINFQEGQFPSIKAYGCCHEVFATQEMLSRVYATMTGATKPARADISINLLGINHFTWVDRAEYDGTDLLALLREYTERPGVVRKFSKYQVERKGNIFIDHHQVCFELFRRFGVLPAAGDRHFAEFVPWFLTNPDSCYRWGFCLTPYSYRIERFRSAPKQFRRELSRGLFPQLQASGEDYLSQMRALLGHGRLTTNVNSPNRGQMQNAPIGAVVETNAQFSTDEVAPVFSGALPENVNMLVVQHILNQESVITAVFNNDRDHAFQAFLNDPLVRISVDDAWRLFNIMLNRTGFAFSSPKKKAGA